MDRHLSLSAAPLSPLRPASLALAQKVISHLIVSMFRASRGGTTKLQVLWTKSRFNLPKGRRLDKIQGARDANFQAGQPAHPMASTDIKLKHLEFIQAVITRMNNCSFLLKGWSVTLISALLALSAKDTDIRFVWIAFFPAIVFWILDGFFLDQERRYRKLYAMVISDSAAVPELEMNTTKIAGIGGSWFATLFSKTLIPFHGVVLGTILLVMVGFAATRAT
jgi:hypothetical protein